MHSIPFSLKKILFKKGKHQRLTPDEQGLWDEAVEWQRPQNAIVDPDDPQFRNALKLYVQLKQEDEAAWEKLQQVIFQDTRQAAIIKPVKNPIWLWTKRVVAAIVLGIACYWLGGYNKTDQPKPITIITPADKVRVTTLPDGSTAWLNKGSVITYPETFAVHERHIKLDGEAYFIVKHDVSKPFRITAGNVTITDEGTEFDVSGYAHESSVITTLKEGKVRIQFAGEEKELSPGQQAIMKANSIQVLQPVNIDSTLSWKNQFITLEGETIESVMKQISDYYNVEYSIDKGLPPLGLKGEISVENTLAGTLKILNKVTHKFSFYIKDGKIVVSAKN